MARIDRDAVQKAIESYDDGAHSEREGNLLHFDGTIDLDGLVLYFGG